MVTNKEYMLTTFDNPYNPFDQFTQWNLFDVEKGYNTASHLARITKHTDDMTEQEEIAENERAIDFLIEHDLLNIYKKVDQSAYESVSVT